MLALLVAAWFLVLRDVLARFDVTDPVARWWALALLGPAALLAVRAWRCRGDRSWFGLALGAVAAAGGALWLSELVPDDVPRCSPA